MKLAFVDNFPGVGGLSRFSLLLCKSLIENHPSLHIDYFIHNNNLKYIPEIAGLGGRVNIKVLNATRSPSFMQKVLRKIAVTTGRAVNTDGVITEIEQRVGKEYDLAYFSSAHMMKRPMLSIPVVGTLHDFNWKYFFGSQIFPLPFVEMMDKEILQWMNNGLNICSSQDVVDEAKKLYPGAQRFPAVVPIAPVIFNNNLAPERAEQVLKELNIDFPYIIFPGNFFPHKNHLNLFTAFSLLKKRPGFASYKLILTGLNSEQVPRGIAEYRGVQMLTKNSASDNFDVMGMGYQSNEVIDVLISKARLLVSPSIYEAICTPGMDAWNFGTPTAISDIPPFTEHEKTWGIKSAFFDPMNPQQIADTMEKYLNNYTVAAADGIASKQNLKNYTWKQVAEGYMTVFNQAIN
jgi:glycosyltransferase involved in cell wall biosynthesis